MAKLKLPRGLYLQARARKDDIVFRWGHAPRLRERGITPFDFFADGRPLSSKDLEKHGFPAGTMPPLVDGQPVLHAGRAQPLGLRHAIKAAEYLVSVARATADPHAAPTETRSTRSSGTAAPMTVGDLMNSFFHPRELKKMIAQRDITKKTIASYKSWRAPIDEIFRYEPCMHMDEDLVEEWFGTMKAARGHRMAYGGFQLLRRVWNWGRRKYRLHEIIWTQIHAPKPPAKLRIASQLELTYLLRAMDDPRSLLEELGENVINGPTARPELGDSLVLAIWTTQRASNILALTDHNLRSGRIRYQSTKNKTRIDMPIVGDILPARIEAARKRRMDRGLTTTHLVAHPSKDAAYGQKKHGDHFRAARALAARFAPSLIGEGLDDWGEPNKTFTFEDCRDTAITRLLRAGCSIDEIISWSNHRSANSLRSLAQSYLASDGEVADRVGEKVNAYVKAEGIAI